MDRDGGQRGGRRDEQEHEQAVVGAAALGDRHDRQPVDPDLHRHPVADEAVHHRRQRVDEQPGQHAGDQA